MRILIVDDNTAHSELAARRLMREGWEVSVTDKPEPDESFKNYDFLLLDYSMPLRSGLDVLKILRDMEITTPVIFLTGHGNEMIASEAIKQGAYDYVVKDTQLLYLERLPSIIREAKSKHELIETNRFLIQELRRANERLQKMTFTDEMTGIYNYRFMIRQVETEVQRALRYSKNLSVCVIDIDSFKEINDHFGHPAGDAVLKELASILREATRTVDFVGRYAGDEFIIIFPDTPLADAVRLCERIRSKVSEHQFFANERILSCSISIGVADFDGKRRKTSDALIDSADKCLYQAKRAGKNRVFSSLRILEKKSEASASAPL
jgi:two-component system cell cycle response regulator